MPERKASERQLSAAEKRVKALEYKRAGKNYREIARLVGWRSPASAHDAVMKALRETMQEPADELRQVEGDRLDWLWRKVVERIEVDHLWAVDRALKIMERRAALLGLDTSGADDPTAAAQRYLDLYNMAVSDAADRSERGSEA